MSNPVIFGRRVARPGSAPATPLRARAAPVSDGPNLSAEADRFRASLAAERRTGASDFDRFMRAQRFQRVMATTIQILLLLPGVLCFIYSAPRPVSGGVEVLGIAVGFWLKRERRRRITNIASWREDDQASV